MTAITSRRVLLVGIGSPHGDDQAGWLIAERLRDRVEIDVEVKQASTPSHLLDWLDKVDRLIVCDACLDRRQKDADRQNAQKPGEEPRAFRWEWPTPEVSRLRSAGSHAFGLPEVLQLAERLGRLPASVTVFGIPGAMFDSFSGLSSGVEKHLPEIVESVRAEVVAGSGERG